MNERLSFEAAAPEKFALNRREAAQGYFEVRVELSTRKALLWIRDFGGELLTLEFVPLRGLLSPGLLARAATAMLPRIVFSPVIGAAKEPGR